MQQSQKNPPKVADLNASRQITIGFILVVALLAFEVFNFDTTQYALGNLLGSVSFAGLSWATILAIAFCAIDFSGLVHLFTPEKGRDEPKEIWFLTGAWLLGATLNAGMTWWAVSLALLEHPNLGNEVLTRAQLLQGVPVFVAALVWVTRILFIGSISVASEHLVLPQRTGVQAGISLGLGKKQRIQPQPMMSVRQPIRANSPRPQPVLATATQRPQTVPVTTTSAHHATPVIVPQPMPTRNVRQPQRAMARSRSQARAARIQFELPQTDRLPGFLQQTTNTSAVVQAEIEQPVPVPVKGRVVRPRPQQRRRQ